MDARSLEEKIRQRAFEIYLARGEVAGRDREDWLQAEREILVGERPLGRIDPIAEESRDATDFPRLQVATATNSQSKRRARG